MSIYFGTGYGNGSLAGYGAGGGFSLANANLTGGSLAGHGAGGGFASLQNSGLSFIPFGSFAGANLGGSNAFFSPFVSPESNQFSALTEPYSFNPQFINLPPLDDVLQQNAQMQGQPSLIQETVPESELGVPTGSIFDSLFEWKAYLDEFFKKFYIGVFAIVLIILGLYFIAKSTDEGAIAIGALKKAV